MEQDQRQQPDIQRLCTLFSDARENRKNFDAHWNDIAEVTCPVGAIFFDDRPEPGDRDNRHVFDSTAIHANELLSSGFFSLLTSPTTPWFNLRTNHEGVNQMPQVKQWLFDVTQIMTHEIQRPQTGFTTALHENYLEYGAFGNCVLFLTEKQDRSSLLFHALPLVESFLMENDEGYIDTCMRRYKRTAAQLESKFGRDALATPIKECMESVETNKMNQKFDVVHFIMPSKLARIFNVINDFLPYTSIYLDITNKHIMKISGYEEMPFMAARFYKYSYETYGRGPGSTTLSDVRMLQELVKTTLRGAQKMVDPPLQMPDEGFITPPRMQPGGMNYYRDANAEIKPILTGGRPDIGLDLVMDVRNRIREAYFVDQLQLNIGPQMTATEVLQWTEEKLRLMGPVVGRVSSELLSPMIVRAFGLLMRSGKLPPPPDVFLENQAKLKVVYTSPIVKAQEQVGANNLTRAIQVVTPLLAGDPTTLDVLDVDQIVRKTGDHFSLDPSFFREQEEVDEIRSQRAQQQEELQAAQQLKDTGIGLNNLARAGQALGSTDMAGLEGLQ